MTDIFTFLAHRAIEEAIQKGELNHLKGMGEPLPDLEGTAMDRMMKVKGLVPREVALRKKRTELQAAGAAYEEWRNLDIEIKVLTEQRMLQQTSR